MAGDLTACQVVLRAMAGEYLRSRGLDIDAEMARIQNTVKKTGSKASTNAAKIAALKTAKLLRNVSLPNTPRGSRWDVWICEGKVIDITARPNDNLCLTTYDEGHGALLAPSLCHPHVHIDKAYLLSHPKYARLQVENGDFSEAMTLTGKAKADFEEWDLIERGQRVIDESAAAGVTHMRAFVEVDAVVGTKCLDAGLKLKDRAYNEAQRHVQLSAFAQMPLFSPSQGDENGSVIRKLMQEASSRSAVDVIGSTPYVEADKAKMQQNVEWMVGLSIECDVHLDFHLDYNLEPESEPMVWHVIKMLKEKKWKERTQNKTVVLGHCTRLTLFSAEEWQRLKEEIGDLPISFVGLPTSDLFMMRTPDRTRGTLDVLTLITEYSLNACIGINNIGNAFTPHGSCDPLTLACNGVGVYQAGTTQDAELLYECVSTRARKAIGLQDTPKDDTASNNDEMSLELKVGDEASLVLFGTEKEDWRTRRTVAEVVYLYDHCQLRRTYLAP